MLAKSGKLVDIEICAGSGGMTIGLQRAGFQFSHLFEIDGPACATLKQNHISNGGILNGEIHQEDIATIKWSDFSETVRLFAAGAPCQPFSLGGRHLSEKDNRNLFPEVLRAIRTLRPQAAILENVSGLIRPSFRLYFEYILRQLTWPSIAPKEAEEWRDHNWRISQHQKNTNEKPEYMVTYELLEAADFGVPQVRKRIMIVTTRSDVLDRFEFPTATHGRESLIRIQNNGEYWKEHGINSPNMCIDGIRMLHLENNELNPWKTVRDAIRNLPEPAHDETLTKNNHWFIPGARVYRGHSGSRLDWPSKTIKAGVHGVPGGENVVILDDGNHRYFTLRETALLQGFPDDFIFEGARLHVTRQIGNAVPVDLADAVGGSLFNHITNPETNCKRQHCKH